MRLAELRLDGGAVVTGEAGRARARERGDQAGLDVEFANTVVEALDPADVACAVEAYFVRFVQFRGERGTTIACEPLLTIPGYGNDLAIARHLADPMVHRVADIKRTVGTAGDAVWISELGGGRRAAVAGESFHPGAGKRGYACSSSGAGGNVHGREEQDEGSEFHGARGFISTARRKSRRRRPYPASADRRACGCRRQTSRGAWPFAARCCRSHRCGM